MARRKIIAGNWKMNKTPSEAVALINELKPLVANDAIRISIYSVYRPSTLSRQWKPQREPTSPSEQRICILRRAALTPERSLRIC